MKKSFLLHLLSFTIPLTILSIILSTYNIWWNSETTILASDGFHQYVIFATALRNILHGQDSIFYSFSSGLGLNFYALISYYLGSFLSPLVYFFDAQSMPDAIYLLTLIKVGLIGLSTYFSLSRIYQSLEKWLTLLLSTSFALMSFAMGQIEINMWLDVFILFPLIMLGLRQLICQRNLTIYFTSLSILFVLNYYFGYMVAIFVSLYLLSRLIAGVKQPVKVIRDFIVTSLCAGLTSSIMLLPTYLDLKTHGETLTELSSLLTENAWYFDLFAKSLVGSYDTTKFGSIASFSVGLLPLVMAISYFTLTSVSWRQKLGAAFLIITLVTSFYLEPLDLFWQGMHAPNMFLHRYSWLLSFVIIDLAAQSLNKLEELKLKNLIISFGFIIIGFLTTLFFKSHYDFLQLEHFTISFLFVTAYATILVSYLFKQVDKKLYIILTTSFLFFEVGINTYYQIGGLAGEWNFPSRAGYAKELIAIDSLVNQVSSDTDFFRMERLLPQTGNDSMKFGYNGISQFSSVRNRHSSQVLDKLGFRSDGTNLNLRYQNNTLIADSLFAIKYNLSEQPLNKYGFNLVNQIDNTLLYQNTNTSQLAILTERPYEDIDFTINTLDNQTDWLNQLAGLEETYFYRLDTSSQSLINPDQQEIETTPNEDGSSSADLTIQVTGDSQVYLSLPSLTSSNPDNKTTKISIDGQIIDYTRDNSFSLFDLGYYPEGRELTVELIFPDTDEVSFTKPNVYALNIPNYQLAMDKINSRQIQATIQNNQVLIDYDSPKATSILVSLPYDKGWSAKLDNRAIPIKQAQTGLMRLDVPEGAGQVVLTFIPYGFKLGFFMSLLGVIGFLLYSKLTKT